MPNLRLCSSAIALIFLIATAATAGGLFLDLTIDEALARAKAEEKIVFIDFFAEWCGPCKQLDSSTFADEKVTVWLGEHTVPLKVDVDQDKDVAKRFFVKSMPTLVFLRADGTELQRIQGYQTSNRFLEMACDVVERPERDAVTRARDALETDYWPEAMARQKLATALLVTGQQEEALGEYVKAMDSLGTDPMSRRFQVRLVHEVCALSEDYPPAGEKMAALRQVLAQRLEDGEAEAQDVEQIIAIDTGLHQKEKSVELYNSLMERDNVPAELLAGFARTCREQLLEDRQYEALAAQNSSGLVRTLSRINSLQRQREIAVGDFGKMPEKYSEQMKKRFDSMSEEQRAMFLTGFETHAVQRVGEDYQIALGLGKTTDAMVIAEKLLEVTSTAEAYHVLAVNALRSGNPAGADLEFAGKALELDKGEHPEYVLTRFQLLEHFDSDQVDAAGEAELESSSTEVEPAAESGGSEN